ncbi:unnamed protein product [Paramecium sonneborni]|uniref:Uncharacterized protein n=1 Tax=Paramecium sonneborni TaxID=65129 RepID=A0A8S1NJ13_9CILI|nr:unnamed protein product [Paramecium sonneborni]
MKQNSGAPPTKQQPQQQQPPSKDPPKTSGKANDQKQQQSQQLQPNQQPKTAHVSPPKKETVKASTNDIDHIQKMKQTMMDFQNKYFETLKNKQDSISQKLSLRNAERVEDKILNAIRKGVLQLENSKYNYVEGHMMDKKVLIVEKEKDQLQTKLQNVDSELKTLKSQKINNAYSAYSQPTLKLYMQEENLTKQQLAQETVQKIQNEAKTRRDKTNKILSEKERKEKEEEERKKQEDAIKTQQMKEQLHAKLRENIEDLKAKQKQRLEKMDKMEDEYFQSLNDKLQKMNKERALIASVDIPKVQLKPYKNEGQKRDKKKKTRPQSASPVNKTQHPPKKIEIEQPLYMRVLDKYNKKIQKQQDIVNQERKKKMEKNDAYNQEYEEHMKEYLKKLKMKKLEYEEKRMKALEKLGLEAGKFSQNVNASFDSKLWLLQESRVNKSLDDISVIPKESLINQAKEKKQKIINYDKKVKETIKIQKDKEKEEELMVLRDKTIHPERYIRMVKKNDKEQGKEPEFEIFQREEEARQQKEREAKEKDLEKFKKIQEKAKKDLEQSIILSKVKEEEKKKKDEFDYEYEESLARQKGKEYLKEFKELHQKALELEKEEREKQLKLLQEQQKKRKLELPQITSTPKIVKNQTLGTLERHDYLQEVLQQAKKEREDKKEKERKEKEEKIKEEERKKVEERRKREEGLEQSPRKVINQEDLDDEQKEELKRKKLAQHNQKVDKIKKKYIDEKTYGESSQTESSLKRKADQVSKLEKQTKSMESIAEATWTTKPLKAVEQAQEVDALYIKSIQQKLNLLSTAQKA